VIPPRTAAGLLVLAAALGGCSSSSPAKPAQSSFDATAAQPGCMGHQQQMPSATDTGKPDIARSLAVLGYYTKNGQKPFCDGKPASPIDLTWMRYYVAQGAAPSGVSRWLGAG